MAKTVYPHLLIGRECYREGHSFVYNTYTRSYMCVHCPLQTSRNEAIRLTTAFYDKEENERPSE
jgi:hypothetical protein